MIGYNRQFNGVMGDDKRVITVRHYFAGCANNEKQKTITTSESSLKQSTKDSLLSCIHCFIKELFSFYLNTFRNYWEKILKAL